MLSDSLRDCEGWIFDLDGTLTVAAHDFDSIRAELGLPVGQPILEELEQLPMAEAVELRERLDAIELELAGASRPADGALALLDELVGRDVRRGILTRNTRRNARVTLGAIGLGVAFAEEDILGRGEAPPKPDPTGIQNLIERWGVSVGRTVMVGDFRFDLEAGRAAGVRTVHADPTGGFDWPELTDVRVRSLVELVGA